MATPDPGYNAWRKLRNTALAAQQEAEDAAETQRIALEQISIDVDAWLAVDDCDLFVRGERLA